MNWLDILILGTVAFSAFAGLRAGIIKAVAAVVGIGLGTVLAGQYYSSLAPKLSSVISGVNEARIAAFIVILVIVLAGALVAGSVVQKIASLLFLGWVDRLAGALLGVAVTSFVWGVILITLAQFPFSGVDTLLRESSLAPLFVNKFPLLLGMLPEEFEKVRSFF